MRVAADEEVPRSETVGVEYTDIEIEYCDVVLCVEVLNGVEDCVAKEAETKGENVGTPELVETAETVKVDEAKGDTDWEFVASDDIVRFADTDIDEVADMQAVTYGDADVVAEKDCRSVLAGLIESEKVCVAVVDAESVTIAGFVTMGLTETLGVPESDLDIVGVKVTPTTVAETVKLT